MDVQLNEDQTMLQEMTRRFLEDKSPIGALRRLVDTRATFDREVWRQSAELGWIALFVPEENGGIAEAALGVADAAIVAQELGRVVFSGPFLSCSVVAFAIALTGSGTQRQEWLPGLSGGETTAAWCFAGPGNKAGIEPGSVVAVRGGDGYVLDGVAGYVEHAESADLLLVTSSSDDGLVQFVLPANSKGISIQPMDPVDLGRTIATVRFDGVAAGPASQLGGNAGEAFERQLQAALVLQCAETVGVTDRAFEFTLEWVNERYAFGRPIGSYQALKHRLADHVMQLEGAKAAAAHAARSVQTGAADAAAAVSVAKSQCGRSATRIIRDCLQMHGGIGLTWEHDIHFYLRRAVSNEMLWGSPAVHHERLARLAGV